MKLPDSTFWQGRRVLVTGHTGFKGSWLCLWLSSLGARIHGFALPPDTVPNLFDLAQLGDQLEYSEFGDIRDRVIVQRLLQKTAPEIVFHLAAQPLVRQSYADPVGTYETNVMGTVNLLEATRTVSSVRAIVNVTTDKCYDNHEHPDIAYIEDDALGGYDPYSSSKACSELVTAAYRNSFFNLNDYSRHRVAIATARAGNVIGGGDWAADRLIPDCVRALQAGKPIVLRNPTAIRPWQHVLDPLCGYLLLGERLVLDGPIWAEPWNFGPETADAQTVEWVVRRFCQAWGKEITIETPVGKELHEAAYLRLDAKKAQQRLDWQPVANVAKAIDLTAVWMKEQAHGRETRSLCLEQLRSWMFS
jgi:CDP-glucose 4,6-dehydratase